MTVTWVTYASTDSVVEFGISALNLSSRTEGQETVFRYGDKKKRKQFIHRATMGPLEPTTAYCEPTYNL